LPGDSKDAILKSPILKPYIDKGYEVLILDDPVDEYVTQHLTEYEKRKVKSIAKNDVQILNKKDKTTKKKNQKLRAMFQKTLQWCNKAVKDVFKMEQCQISQKEMDAPIYIFTSEYGYSAQMEKIQKAQAFANSEKQPGYMSAKKTLEMNSAHPIIKKIRDEINSRADRETMSWPKPEDATHDNFLLMVRMALLQSGFILEDPHELADPVEKLVRNAMGIEAEEAVEAVDFTMSEDEPDSESDGDKKEGSEGEAAEEEPEEEEEADDNNNEEEEAEAVADDEQMVSDDL